MLYKFNCKYHLNILFKVDNDFNSGFKIVNELIKTLDSYSYIKREFIIDFRTIKTRS